MISGMVINGPTPIMSVMLSAVACASPMPRVSFAGGELSGFMPHAQQIDVEADGARHSGRQLAEERIR